MTGGELSNIDGLLRANGTANLFLLNPQGIIFGPNASLNIGGSFVGSTASSLNFADGTQFSATAPQNTPLLTISVPIGLQYGGNPGSIQVQGDGQGIRLTTELIDTTTGLRVEPNQTLALVGGNVALLGGTLKTAGGRIELGSVAEPSLVSLNPTEKGFSLGYESVPTFGDIQLSGAATVDASGAGGAEIQVQGRRVTLTNGSQIETSTLGAEPGGTLNIRAKESVEAIGISAVAQYPSALLALVYDGATGAGGNLTIQTGRLTLQGRAQVLTNTFGSGTGGTLSVIASDVVEVIGRSADSQIASGLFAQTSGNGNAGDLTIATGRLNIRDGAQVSTGTYGTGSGSGGTLSVTASDVVEVIGRSADGQRISSGLVSQTEGDGNAGDLTIATRRLTVQGGVQVSAGTFGTGAGGTLSVSASDVVEVIGTLADSQFPSGLFAQTEGDGNAGDLTIATRQLTVRDGAQVSAGTFGTGAGGRLSVSASDVVEVIGTSADGQRISSGLISQTEGDGNAGDLTIATRRLTVQGGAFVSTSTFGTGTGGMLSVSASDVVEVIGESADGQRTGSRLVSQTQGDGNAGDLTIATGRLTVQGGAFVSTGTTGTGAGGMLSVSASDVVQVIGTSVDGRFNSSLTSQTQGDGNAGDLTIATRRLTVQGGAEVSNGTRGTGDGGGLSVSASEVVEVIGESADGQLESGLYSQTLGEGDAGDLTIATGRLTVQDGAQVAVSSLGSGNAGNLEVTADSIRLNNLAFLSSDTPAGQGNIFLNSQDLVLRRGSNITTNARDTAEGGNITIDTDVLVAIENSDISANSQNARGGRVTINASGIFGTQFRSQRTSLSDITATGGTPELSGTVEINRLDVDPTQGIVELPAEVVDASNQIAQSCPSGVREGKSKFIVTGRGGLPPDPHSPLSGDHVLTNLATLDTEVENRASAEAGATKPTQVSAPTPIVEASGWTINDRGKVVLTASIPTAINIPWLPESNCNAPSSS